MSSDKVAYFCVTGVRSIGKLVAGIMMDQPRPQTSCCGTSYRVLMDDPLQSGRDLDPESDYFCGLGLDRNCNGLEGQPAPE